MQIGKVPENVLERSVLKHMGKKRPEVIVGAKVGRDFSAIELSEGEVFLITTTTIDTQNKSSFYIGLHKMVNSILIGGAYPVGLMLNIILPFQGEEVVLKALMRQASEFCKEREIQIIGGHSELSKAVNCAVVTITGIGKVKKDDMILSSHGKPNQEIVITKSIGIEGTALLAIEQEKKLREKYSNQFVQQAKDYIENISIAKEVGIIKKYAISALHDLSNGGVFASLWEVAVASKVGLEIDLCKIPIKQETVEICEVFNLNPYQMMSTGSLLIVADRGSDIVEALSKEGIEASVIGKTTDGKDRIVYNEEERRFLEPPKIDERYQMML